MKIESGQRSRSIIYIIYTLKYVCDTFFVTRGNVAVSYHEASLCRFRLWISKMHLRQTFLFDRYASEVFASVKWTRRKGIQGDIKLYSMIQFIVPRMSVPALSLPRGLSLSNLLSSYFSNRRHVKLLC